MSCIRINRKKYFYLTFYADNGYMEVYLKSMARNTISTKRLFQEHMNILGHIIFYCIRGVWSEKLKCLIANDFILNWVVFISQFISFPKLAVKCSTTLTSITNVHCEWLATHDNIKRPIAHMTHLTSCSKH